MRTLCVSLAVSAFLIGSSAMFADPIPYPGALVGTVAPAVELAATGSTVTAYYAGSSAADLDEIDVIDVTDGKSTGLIFSNNGQNQSALGASVALTGLSAGDTIVIDLFNSNTGYTFSSDPVDSADGVNHAYITAFTSSDTLAGLGPGGTGDFYVGMEDLIVPGADLDYNDEAVVLTGVVDPPSTSVTPEPGSIVLLGTGILSLMSIVMVRRQSPDDTARPHPIPVWRKPNRP